MLNLGFDPRKLLLWRFYPRFFGDRRKWLQSGGTINRNLMILRDFADSAGTARGHYFHQDLLVASLINEHGPTRHLDIGSRIDGFVAHVASFRKIEVLDVRPLPPSVHNNIQFQQVDLMKPNKIGTADSVSCLHVIEHFGLGRYTDEIDIDGHKKGLSNLIKLVAPGGRLYLSVPIGNSDEVHFNAHRVFHPESLLQYAEVVSNLRLLRFDFVDDSGDLHQNTCVSDVPAEIDFGCGIYTFERLEC